MHISKCHNVTETIGIVLQFQKFVSTLQQTHSNKIAQSGGGGRCAPRTGSTRAIFPDKYYCDTQTDTNRSNIFLYLDKRQL